MTELKDVDTTTVRGCVQAIIEGRLSSEKLVEQCLSNIDDTDADIGAWQCLDREHALDQAKTLDDIRRRGEPTGDLHGIPIGIKDIFDTIDFPTERGSPIYAGRQAQSNAAVVDKLLEAGAVIMGKTVTTEFAWMNATDTRNPHDSSRSPGGSSSGSAAGVAAGHVPLSIGSQTNGSVIRPASYCGVYGFKPSTGIVSRQGVLQTSQTLDQVGVFGNDLGDLALISDVIAGYDVFDSLSYLAPRPGMLEGYSSKPPVAPNFAWINLPYADRLSADVNDGFAELMEALGKQVDNIPTPQFFNALVECHQIIYDYEIFRCLENERENHRDQLSEKLRTKLDGVKTLTEAEYHDAKDNMQTANKWFEQFFYDYDGIISPAAVGVAPKLDEGTGDPICSTIWTLCGLPCVTMPLLTGGNNLPIGVQIIAGAREDDRLFRSSHWLLNYLKNNE